MKNKIGRNSIVFIIAISMLSFASAAFAGTYWVSSNGTASWSDCKSASPLSGTSACSLSTANRNAAAGDIIYLRGGIYNGAKDNISPNNSGTSWSEQITYSAYNNETVTITSQLIPNRTMETDTGWSNHNSPTNNSQSSYKAYDGAFSRKFSVNAEDDGIKSDIFTTSRGLYIYSAWVYSAESTINVYIYNGSAVVVDSDVSISPNRWFKIRGNFSGRENGSYVAFRSPTGISSGDWYIDNVRITRYQAGIELSGKDYIRVYGIDFKTLMRGFRLSNGADYNEIDSSTFTDLLNEQYFAVNIIASDGGSPNSNNWIHHNTIYDNGLITYTCNDAGSSLRVGANTGDASGNNLIEDNIFYHSAHDLILIASANNVVRNNVWHNEGYLIDHYGDCVNTPSAGFGNRNIILENPNQMGGFNLIEGNRIGYAGTPPDDDGSHGIENPTDGNIIRYNALYGNGGSGMYWKPANGYPDNNRFYNNTVYNNGGGEDIRLIRQAGISYGSKNSTGNVIKNNIVYSNTDEDIKYRGEGDTITNNWLTTDGDPLFVNTDMSDKMSLTLPDLSLQPGSGAIDQGTALTTVDNSDTGSGTSLIVADSTYFQDSSWGPSGKVDADWIAVGSVENIVQISSIDYTTNTITLSSAISRSDGDNIWLYKDSAGNIVLSGSAPDIGAHEFTWEPAPRVLGQVD